MSAVPKDFITGECCEACGRPFEFKAGRIDITLDLDSLRYKGEEIHLSLRQGQLMRVLLRAYPNGLHRERIYLSVWGVDSDVCDKTMDVIFCKMRKKLAPIGLGIANMHGVGFKLTAAAGNA